MKYTMIGSIPRHQYLFVDSTFTHKDQKEMIPCVWFGIVSYPGRMWGANILLESGAIYRNVPIHALSYDNSLIPDWYGDDAQIWDCYSEDFAVHEYPYLKGARVRIHSKSRDVEYQGNYLFSVLPMGDGYSAQPETAKEFAFVRLATGCIAVRPTNYILWSEDSITLDTWEWPTNLRRQTETYHCE